MLVLDGMQDGEIKLTLTKMLPEGHPDIGTMPVMFFKIRLLDGTWIGSCDLRLGDGPKIAVLGHIGYDIHPRYRGHHYAAKACRLLMGYARRAHMTSLEITCNTDNVASIRTCEHLGGQRDAEMIVVPEDNIEYANGSRMKYRYRFAL